MRKLNKKLTNSATLQKLRETPLCKIGVPMGRRFLRTGKPPKVKKEKVKKDKSKKKKGGSSGKLPFAFHVENRKA